MLRDGHVVGLEGERPGGQVAEPPSKPAQEIALRLNHFDAVEGTGGLEIAPVGREHDAVRPDDACGVRALETREVENVDRVRDEQVLSAGGLELGPNALDPLRSLPALRQILERLPVALRPLPDDARGDDILDHGLPRRHFSRFVISERCTSTTGTSTRSRASRIA